MSESKQKLLILDANALVHRAFHALPPTMMAKDGTPTNAVYGFTSVLIKVLKEIKPTHIAVCFDVKKETFRNAIYPEYKATRLKQADELYIQFPIIKEIINTFNINIFEKEGYEADDLIGTISKQIEQTTEVVILTGDKDTLQLVDDQIHVLTFKKGLSETLEYDKGAVESIIGVRPDQIIDYKALRGDPSDNIPGVKGIGEKTAVELLKQFNTLENLYKQIECVSVGTGLNPALLIKERIRNLLIENKDKAFLSYRLATIKLDVETDFNLESCKIKEFNLETMRELFMKLEFKTLLDRVLQLQSNNNPSNTITNQINSNEIYNYKLLNNENEIVDFLNILKKQEEFVFDTETTSENPHLAEMVGVSFCFKENECFYFDWKNLGTNFDLLKEIFENKNIKKIAHNIKYDIEVLSRHNINAKNIYFDTMVAAYILSPGERKYGLDTLSFSEFGHQMQSIKELIGEGKKQTTMNFVDPARVCNYCCDDSNYTFKLYKKYLKEILLNEKTSSLFFNIDMSLIEVLKNIEENGVSINTNYLKNISEEYEIKIKNIQSFVFDKLKFEFNLNSPKQLQDVLFDKLKIKTKGIKKTKTGISTASEQLEKIRELLEEDLDKQSSAFNFINSIEANQVSLKDQIEILNKLIEYREYEKLKTTYIDVLPELINKNTNRIHASFNQTIAVTGRLSSTDPNLQNIPVRTEDGKKIRKAFITDDGYKIVSIDYSQVELRIMASLAKQESMMDAFINNIDIHSQTAALINNIKLEDVTKEQRRAAKAINFGIIYGMGARKLSRETGMSFNDSKDYIEKYFKLNNNIEKYINETIRISHRDESIENVLGRKRYFKDINSSQQFISSQAERMAVNMTIQGLAADIMKIAMINIYNKIKDNEDIKTLIQVHDELVFEIKENKLQELIPMLKLEMENAYKLPNNVPLKADVEVGNNWGELEEYN